MRPSLPDPSYLQTLHDYENYKTLFDHIADGAAIRYWPHFREFGIPVEDGGSSVIALKYCPWTGCQLPPSLRDEWFTQIEALGLDPDDAAVPEEFRSDQWWRSGHLAKIA
ncbi:DUF6980 family protein [Microvirga arabica]|uniref:DUF6980 family protein n=1 Tax=Microvirga arabica TaxID=1128671 RepID=UPI00193A8A9F|nr:hypothetical protein [Microvirga arabica]MBM1172047.1 hypothetical protein [Microvirga arabica]